MKIRLTQKVTNISLLTGIIELDEVDCHHIFLGIEQDQRLKNGQLLARFTTATCRFDVDSGRGKIPMGF